MNKLLDFLLNDANGARSTTKLWRHVAFITATYAVAVANPLTWEFLLAYLAVVSGSELGKRMIEAKYGITTPTKEDSQ